jgi:hypothetical protein
MVWWVVGAGGVFVAEGTSGVYDSLIRAVYDAWDPRYKVLYMPVDSPS